MKIKKTSNRGLKIAVVFSTAVIIVLIIAFVVRVSILFSQRQFDNYHNFILLDIKNTTSANVISFAPDKSSITIVHVHTTSQDTNIGKELKIPINAKVTDPEMKEDAISSLLWRLIRSFNSFHPQGLNIIDAFSLFFYSQKIHGEGLLSYDITIPYTSEEGQTINSVFVDHTIYTEGLTVSIVNASDVSGRGSKLADLLTNIGCHVIAVNTADTASENSTIASNKNTVYTVKKLKKILNLQPGEFPQNALSDIIITIGKKDAYSSLF